MGLICFFKPNFRVTSTEIQNFASFKGGAAVKKYAVLADKRHIVTRDTEQNVAIYDVLKVIKVEDLGKVDFDEVVKSRNRRIYIPNWFTVDLKTGVSNFFINFFTQKKYI